MKLRIFAVIFGLSVLALTDPDIRGVFTSVIAANSELKEAAQCMVVTNYVDWPELREAAQDRFNALSEERAQACISDSDGNALKAKLCIDRPYDEANLRAFPDGDSSNMSTLRRWAKSDYCRKLVPLYRLKKATATGNTPQTTTQPGVEPSGH